MKKNFHTIEGDFTLENGAKITSPTIAYHSNFDFAAKDVISEGKRIIWICHALTANSDPSEWWSDLVGKGKFFDTDNDIIVCANTIGSCYGSTGPSNYGRHPLDFPEFSVRDIVNAHIELRKALGINRIDILAGGSVGGFQAIEWAIKEPETIKNLVAIACNCRISPWGTAFNESQRMAIESDSSFREQKDLDGGKEGLKTARSIALISYRSYKGYNSTQYEKDEDTFSAGRASSYQRYQGEKLAARFDAYSYYYMTKMLDTHNIGRNRGGVENALKKIKARTLAIGIDSDFLFPPQEQKYIAENIGNGKFEQISSDFGHDGFLLEWKSISKAIDDFLKEDQTSRIN